MNRRAWIAIWAAVFLVTLVGLPVEVVLDEGTGYLIGVVIGALFALWIVEWAEGSRS